jgi:hypothetical protein
MQGTNQNGKATTAPVTPPPATAASKGLVSRLAAVQKGRIKSPLRCVFYGAEGVGKTTLAAAAPDPIWIDAEDGSGRVTVARYPFSDEPNKEHVPRTYQEILAAIDDLTRSPHDYKTVVIDTVDKVESMLWRFMIDRDKSRGRPDLLSIEDYGYGKGYNSAVDEWRALCAKLDVLRTSRGMTIILLGHHQIRTFKNPEADDYERFSMQLNEKAAGFLKSWADVVGFCRFEEGAGKLKGQARAKGWSTGKRTMHLCRSAAYDAKGRGGMPDVLELDPVNPWANFAKAVEESESLGPDALIALIKVETDRIGDPETTDKVAAAVTIAAGKGDTEALNRYLQELKRREARVAA